MGKKNLLRGNWAEIPECWPEVRAHATKIENSFFSTCLIEMEMREDVAALPLLFAIA